MPDVRGVQGNKTVERAPVHIPGNTLLDVTPFEQYAIRYVDAEGVIHKGVAIKFNGEYYLPANGEEWEKGLRPANEWLAKQLRARDEAKGAVPKGDNVDIVP
jgi:hypothetical protein